MSGETESIETDGFREECGVFGIYGHPDAANLAYLGLYALQHRGQEAGGIAAWNGRRIAVEKGMGYVADLFDEARLARLPGRSAVGHVRYSTAGASLLENAKPIVYNTNKGPLAIAHNGNLVNAEELRAELEQEGSIFTTSSDTEVFLHLMARSRAESLVDALRDALAHFDSVATSTGKRFLTVGIALDQIDSLGLLHLRALGRFDYLFPSGAIDNPGQLHVANGYLGLPSVMPQLALVAFDSSAEDRSKVAPRVLFRTEGVHELLRWKDRGWTVPRGGLIQ